MTRAPLALVLVAAALGACGPRPDEPTRAERAAAEATAAAAPARSIPPSTAMLSVYYSARIAEGFPPPSSPQTPGLRVVPLEDAATALTKDTSYFGPRRREQAIVRLAAAGLSKPEHRRAIEILGGNLAQLDEIVQANPGVSHQQLYILISAAVQGAPGAACQTVGAYTVISKGRDGTLAEVTFDVVNQSMAKLPQLIDPQNWDAISDACGDYFEKAYIAQKSNGGYEPGPDCDVAEQTPGEPIGGDWENVLFEHYAYGAATPDGVWFKNLLDVKADQEATTYQMTYGLHESICSQIGNDLRAGGLVKDEGGAHAFATLTGPALVIHVAATKEILLSSRPGANPPIDPDLLNWWTSIYLMAMGDAVERAVCCPFVSSAPQPPVLIDR